MKTAPSDSQPDDNSADVFFAWATDPSRSLEERYGILQLLEFVYARHYRGEDKVSRSFEADQVRREARRFNPAYQPVLDPQRVRIVATLLHQVQSVEFNNYRNDRPIRDLSVLRFLPWLQSLNVQGIEIPRLDVLYHLPALRTLDVWSDEVEDYSAIANCRELQQVTIHTEHPWPILSGLETLPHLTHLYWHGNGRSLIGLPPLSSVTHFRLSGGHSVYSLAGCLRDFHQLPAMPRLVQFWGGTFYRLDGIERYPQLRIALIKGFFTSLAPLAALRHITHLRVSSPRLEEVASVVPIPSLFHFAAESTRPQDWTPLMDSPSLREVHGAGCGTAQPDLGTVRMLLPSADDHFSAATPRHLQPLRLFAFSAHEEGANKAFGAQIEAARYAPITDPPPSWHDCPGMHESEHRWMTSRLEECFVEAGLGDIPGIRIGYHRRRPEDDSRLFHSEPSSYINRSITISLLKVHAISRLSDVINAIRPVLASTRLPWHVQFMCNAEPDADEWDADWRDEDSPQQRIIDELMEDQHREQQRRRQELYLADEHRLRLLREQGHEPAPGEFQTTPLPPPKPLPEIQISAPGSPPAEPKPAPDEYNPFDNDDTGGIAEAEPGQEDHDEHWLPPPPQLDPNFNWSSEVILFSLYENTVEIMHRPKDAEALSYLLNIPAIYPPQSGTGPE